MAKRTGSTSGTVGSIDIGALGKSIAENLAQIQEATKRGEQAGSLAEQFEQQREALEDYNEELKKNNLNIAERGAAETKLIELEMQRLKTERDLNKAGVDTGRTLEEINELLAEHRKKLREASEAADSLSNSFELGSQIGSTFGNAIGVTDNKLEDFVGSLAKGKISMKGFTSGIKSSLNPIKIATSLLSTMGQESYKLMVTVNTVNSQFRKDYGQFGNTLAKTALASEESLRKFNIGYEETALAVESLNVGVSDFVDMSAQQRDSLVRDSALLAKLGVSNEEYAETIQSMTKAFGDSTEGAQENMVEMRKFATAIGKSTKSVMNDFSKVRSYLAQFGSNYEKIFRRMETVARKTGASIEDLQQIALGFDQFEGAAESVGKLNALLGGPFLNTVDMINTEDPAEAIMKIKEAFDASGKSVNSMTRRELQAFATSIPGINGDVEKLRTIFGQLDSGMLDTADSINAVLEGSKETTKSLEDDADASMTIEERQAAIAKQMALAASSMEKAANVMSEALKVANDQGANLRNVTADGTKAALKTAQTAKSISAIQKAGAEVAEAGTEVAVKEAAKGAGKLAGKRIPVTGALVAGGMALSRASEGDVFGAGLEGVSGVLSLIEGLAVTGVGAPIAAAALGGGIGIDAYLAKRDYDRAMSAGGATYKDYQQSQAGPAMAAGGIVTKPVTNATIGEAGREAIIPLENGATHLVEPLTLALKQAMGTGAGSSPNITLKVELGGRELTAFVKQVIVDNLNPFK